MSDAPPPARPGARIFAATLVVVAFAVVVVVVVARLPWGVATPAPAHRPHPTTTTLLHGRAGVEVEIEVPSTATATTVAGATTTTAKGSSASQSQATAFFNALRTAGYDVAGEVADLSPPSATSVQYTTGHEADADGVAELLGLSSATVVAYKGAAIGLAVGTDVIVVVGKAA
jgi:hypothetical protein